MTDINGIILPSSPSIPEWMNDKANALLIEAESRYGARDSSYTFMGVATDPEGPHIRFGNADTKLVYIEISEGSLNNSDQALYQIAHEVIHLLAPNHNPPTTLFEEGLAVWFSIFVPAFSTEEYRAAAQAHIQNSPNAVNYRSALELFEEAQSADSDVVRKIRMRQSSFYKVRPTEIIEAVPAISQQLAERMCQRIKMR